MSVLKRYTGSAWETIGAPADPTWTSYTPTLVQSGAVTKTVTYAKYIQIGKLVIVAVNLAVTGPGTASNAVVIGLPVNAASTSIARAAGTGSIYDSSVGLVYGGVADFYGTNNTIRLWPTSADSGDVLGAAAFTAALASGDAVTLNVMYEAA